MVLKGNSEKLKGSDGNLLIFEIDLKKVDATQMATNSILFSMKNLKTGAVDAVFFNEKKVLRVKSIVFKFVYNEIKYFLVHDKNTIH